MGKTALEAGSQMTEGNGKLTVQSASSSEDAAVRESFLKVHVVTVGRIAKSNGGAWGSQIICNLCIGY